MFYEEDLMLIHMRCAKMIVNYMIQCRFSQCCSYACIMHIVRTNRSATKSIELYISDDSSDVRIVIPFNLATTSHLLALSTYILQI